MLVCCREGSVDIICFFLDRDSEIWDSASKNGRTPLHTAGFVFVAAVVCVSVCVCVCVCVYVCVLCFVYLLRVTLRTNSCEPLHL